MVRLKDTGYVGALKPSVLFQFQYGSIKSTFNAETQSGATLFQFQYGSIKSKCGCRQQTKFD